MFDSSSKISSGMLQGNIADLGNFDECISIEEPAKDMKIFGKFCALSMVFFVSSGKTVGDFSFNFVSIK